MSDIVGRLHCTIRCDIETAASGCHCAEGRDVITALRAEVERLKAELHTASDMNAVYEGRLQEKEAENERLRAALEDIADGLGETDLAEVGRYAKHIARAALEEKP